MSLRKTADRTDGISGSRSTEACRSSDVMSTNSEICSEVHCDIYDTAER